MDTLAEFAHNASTSKKAFEKLDRYVSQLFIKHKLLKKQHEQLKNVLHDGSHKVLSYKELLHELPKEAQIPFAAFIKDETQTETIIHGVKQARHRAALYGLAWYYNLRARSEYAPVAYSTCVICKERFPFTAETSVYAVPNTYYCPHCGIYEETTVSDDSDDDWPSTKYMYMAKGTVLLRKAQCRKPLQDMKGWKKIRIEIPCKPLPPLKRAPVPYAKGVMKLEIERLRAEKAVQNHEQEEEKDNEIEVVD